MRWKALTVAHPMLGQTSFSDILGPISSLLWPGAQNLESILDYNQFAGIPDSEQSDHFKSDEIGPKASENKV